MQKDTYTAELIKVEILESKKGYAQVRVYWDNIAWKDFKVMTGDTINIDTTSRITYL
jgi:hypothetical protein